MEPRSRSRWTDVDAAVEPPTATEPCYTVAVGILIVVSIVRTKHHSVIVLHSIGCGRVATESAQPTHFHRSGKLCHRSLGLRVGMDLPHATPTGQGWTPVQVCLILKIALVEIQFRDWIHLLRQKLVPFNNQHSYTMYCTLRTLFIQTIWAKTISVSGQDSKLSIIPDQIGAKTPAPSKSGLGKCPLWTSACHREDVNDCLL